MPAKRTKRNADSPQVEDRFQAVIDAFAKQRDVTGGKMMSSYGLKVNGKIFAMFGRNQFVAKLPEEQSRRTGERERWKPFRSRSWSDHEGVVRCGRKCPRVVRTRKRSLRFCETRQLVILARIESYGLQSVSNLCSFQGPPCMW